MTDEVLDDGWRFILSALLRSEEQKIAKHVASIMF